MDWNWVPGAVTGTLAIVGVVVAGYLQSRRESAGGNRPGAPTVQEIWTRQDRMERGFRGSLVLLVELWEQHDNKGKLVLNRAAIKDLRDSGYMPSELEDVLNDRGGE
ncbi:membrane protein [Microbacterium phage Milani]|nr:membrane protein [Microbacterium phage Milani]